MPKESALWRRFKAMLVFAVSIAAMWPAIAQDSNIVEIAPSVAKLLRFDSPVATIIIGDPKIADATAHGENIIVLTGKTIGTTNLIVLDSSNKELFNAPVVVSESAKGVGRVTLHATFGRGGSGALQKFHVYRCPRGGLCEIVKVPEVIVQRDVVETEDTGEGGTVTRGSTTTTTPRR